MNVSPHFTLDELTRSPTAIRLGLDNTPAPDAVENLRRLALTVLEPVRDLLAVPVHVDSGYRAPAVNAAVGSTAKNSAHLSGRAGDIVPVGMALADAFDMIRRSAIPYDQLIMECDAWLHIAIAEDGVVPRREDLVASGTPGHWHYVPAPALV